MKQWLVRIGNSELIVEADTAVEAMTKFWTLWDDVDLDDDDFPDANYTNIAAIEVVGDEVFWDTESALKASGRHDNFSTEEGGRSDADVAGEC